MRGHTYESKKPGQIAIVYHYLQFVQGFLTQTLGAHEINFVKLSSKQIGISVLNRPIKLLYFMA